jgi:hypothetical protein
MGLGVWFGDVLEREETVVVAVVTGEFMLAAAWTELKEKMKQRTVLR